ncbi:MAG: hypothetical protein AAGB93_09925 [Planctomycetota bacterium]
MIRPTRTSPPARRNARALAVAAGLLACACATGNYEPGGRYDRSPAEVPRSSAADESSGAVPAEELPTLPGPTEPTETTQRLRMAFPTGDPRTSAVLLEKVFPAEILLEAPVEYQIVVENLTDRPLVEVRVTDEFPVGFEVETTEPNAQQVGSVARWELGMLAPHSAKTILVRGRAVELEPITTSATVDFVYALQATMTVIAPLLEVTVDAPEESVVTRPFDLTVRVTNAGTGDARDVRIIDELPPGMTTESGQRRVVMDFGSLASGQSKEKTIVVQAAASGDFTHEVRARAAGGLEVLAEPVETVVREPRLVLTVKAPPTAPAASPVRIEMTIANTGDGPSEQTTVRSRLPVGVELVSTSEEGAQEGGVVAWWVGTLEPGTSKRVAFTVWRDDPGAFVTEAKATATGAVEVTATSRTKVE